MTLPASRPVVLSLTRAQQCPGLVDSGGIDRLHGSKGRRSVGPETRDPESGVISLVSGTAAAYATL